VRVYTHVQKIVLCYVRPVVKKVQQSIVKFIHYFAFFLRFKSKIEKNAEMRLLDYFNCQYIRCFQL